ncbi:quinoprotein [Pelagivirga sediminicola]|uniref:Quinoprotein n=1 Tax=Pelagivirga sediminicola TaxID=2170575 RepID=A0A2T7G985_9RHOB|nr:PQQ-like beta-propeller repeat protein [Pelagivirga sediminicola]PVA10987.1 quinoprotein [Pelagivirga sediminicola]
MHAVTRNGTIIGLVAAALLLAACSEKDPILPGKREGLREVLTGDQAEPAASEVVGAAGPNVAEAVRLPAASANASWPQRIGTPATRAAHPALGAAPRLIWSASIGAGDGARRRITADPVVAGGRVFAMDANAQVSAHSTSGGALWSTSLVPAYDSASEGSGGGLAYGDGKLFASTGFGRITALDPATGRVIWEQELLETGTATPTVVGNIVYLVAGDETAWALDTRTGRIEWRLVATPSINNILGGPAPAVSDKYAVFAFGSGEVQGAFRKGGLRLWDASIAGRRKGLAQSNVPSIAGDPVIYGDRVYVGNQSGRMSALKIANGERIWTANEGPMNPVWITDDSVFLISDKNELVRLRAGDGSRVWGTKLPLFVKAKPKRQAEVFAHYGPIMAGGQLVTASNDGYLRFFDPASGALRRSVAVPGGATTNPVVAGGVLYVVGTNGQLHAFR